jgi:hypothetical protein
VIRQAIEHVGGRNIDVAMLLLGILFGHFVVCNLLVDRFVQSRRNAPGQLVQVAPLVKPNHRG